MPLHLEPMDVSSDLGDCSSALIVSCPICPPVTMAVEKNAPFIDLFRSGLKTPAFEDHIQSIRVPLERRGVRTQAFTMYAPCPAMCLWTKGQRHRLLKRAKNYQAVVVLGCDTARYTAEQALKDTDCQVIQAMRMTGLTNATITFKFPLTVNFKNRARVGESDEVEKMAG